MLCSRVSRTIYLFKVVLRILCFRIVRDAHNEKKAAAAARSIIRKYFRTIVSLLIITTNALLKRFAVFQIPKIDHNDYFQNNGAAGHCVLLYYLYTRTFYPLVGGRDESIGNDSATASIFTEFDYRFSRFRYLNIERRYGTTF